MNRGSFVVSGPNGSGKSGVVDAIQFALTGEIGRLKGAGTGDLSLSDHGVFCISPRKGIVEVVAEDVQNPTPSSRGPCNENILSAPCLRLCSSTDHYQGQD